MKYTPTILTATLAATLLTGCAVQSEPASFTSIPDKSATAAVENPTIDNIRVDKPNPAAKHDNQAEPKKEVAKKKTEPKKSAPVNKVLDVQTNDADNDLLIDAWEIDNGTNVNKADTDGDGHSDGAEHRAGTSPTNKNNYPGKSAAATPKPATTPAPALKATTPPVKKVETPTPAPVAPTVKENLAATPPASTPKSANAAPAKPAPDAAPGNDGLNWAALAQCESTGNPTAWNPAGYGGLYQFDQQTWASVGGTGSVVDASPAEQTKRAQVLHEQRGASPWPVCGKLL